MDMLSGSWPGELFWFEGHGDGDFSAPVMLQDKEGNYINIGGGIEESEDGISITGNADFEETEDGVFAIYHGERIESTAARPVSITGTASVVHAVDWDGDKDLDLLVGDIGGSVYLIPNEGSITEMSFGAEVQLEGGGAAIRVPGGDAGPVAIDWDGDDDFDLVVGCGDGSVVMYRNDGTQSEPVLSEAIELVAAGEIEYGPEASREAVRGIRAKVCVTDFNSDGTLDLLLGDISNLGHDLSGLSNEEQAEMETAQEEMNELNGQYRELVQKIIGPDRVTEEDELEEVRTELMEVQGRMGELRAVMPEEYSTHGWVWYFEGTSSSEASTNSGE
ncbi:MAG: hypothetical protein AAF456_06120 [Planctomycetota bacterium]